MKPTLYVLRGLPGSGKTERAREICATNPNTKRVNKDLIRAMLDFGVYTPENEEFVREVEWEIVRVLLLAACSVVVDDTNLKGADLDRWMDLHDAVPSCFSYEFVDTPLSVCIARDAAREHPVGAERIRQMAAQIGLIEAETI